MESVQVELDRARQLAAQGHADDALGVTRHILAQLADTLTDLAEVFRVQGQLLYSLGRYDAASTAFETATRLSPSSEQDSFGLVVSAWGEGNFNRVVVEIERYSAEGQPAAYDQLMKAILAYLKDCGESFEIDDESGGTDVPGFYSRESRGLRARFSQNRNPVDQLDGLRKRQNLIRSGQSKGLIEDTKKSEQDVRVELDRIKSIADVHDSPVTKSRVSS